MNKRLFVAGLPYTYNDQSLSALFAQFGQVVSATVIIDRETGKSKGFGFVEMGTDEEAQTAIAKLNDTIVENRKIVVNIARPREDRPRGNFDRPRQDFKQDNKRSRGGSDRSRNRW